MKSSSLLVLLLTAAALPAHAGPCESRYGCELSPDAVLRSPTLRRLSDPLLNRLLADGDADAAYDRASVVLADGAERVTGESLDAESVRDPLTRLLKAESSPWDALLERIAEMLCGSAECVPEAEVLARQSGLLLRELTNHAIPLENLPRAVSAWVNGADEPADAIIDRTAWIIVAEYSFMNAAGMKPDTQRADLEAAALLLSGGASLSMDVAQPSCGEDGLEGPGDLFGTCGMPSAPELPDMGGAGPDPSPIDGRSLTVGRPVQTRAMPRQVGAWAMPGACYGLDPRKVFDGAGAPPESEQSTPAEIDTVMRRKGGDEGEAEQNEGPPTRGETGAGGSSGSTDEAPTRTSLPEDGTPPPQDPPGVGDTLKDTAADIAKFAEFPIGGGVTFHWLESLGTAAKSGITGGGSTFEFKLKLTWRPDPNAEGAAGMCGERFAAILAGCLGAGAEPTGGNDAFSLVCGESNAPILTEGPRPAGCGCAPAPADEGESGEEDEGEEDIGDLDCCAAHCFVASNAGYEPNGFGSCGDCQVGAECGGADASTGSLTERCSEGIGEPLHSQICGALDPSPLSFWFGEPSAHWSGPAEPQ